MRESPNEAWELTDEELAVRLAAAERKITQLQEALDSRVVIEQSKGVLAERLAIPISEAFDLLRYAARSHRAKLHEIARRVVEEGQTPAPVVVAIARASRVRAASMREYADLQRERTGQLAGQVRETQTEARSRFRASDGQGARSD
jgi:hypothetical protein